MSIQSFRKRLANLYAIIPMCALILFATFSAQAKPTIHVPSYSGEQLFEGIFFAHGEVVEHIPEIKANMNLRDWMNSNELREFSQLRKKTIKLIKQNNSGFFNRFRKNIQSGSHLLVKQEIEYAGKVLSDAIYEIKELEDENVKAVSREIERAINAEKLRNGKYTKKEIQRLTADTKAKYSSNAKIDPDSLVALALALAIAVVAVAIIAVVWVWPDYRTNVGDEGLKMDKMINSIAINLKA